jgi:hypothetical protein
VFTELCHARQPLQYDDCERPDDGQRDLEFDGDTRQHVVESALAVGIDDADEREEVESAQEDRQER